MIVDGVLARNPELSFQKPVDMDRVRMGVLLISGVIFLTYSQQLSATSRNKFN